MSRAIVAAVGVIMLSTNTTTVFADNISSPPQALMSIETVNQENPKTLYIIEKELYMEILKKDTAIIENKNNLLVIDSQNLTEEEFKTIQSSKIFHIFGELQKSELMELENYGEQLYAEDKYEIALKLANENTDKNIVIVNGESVVDYFIATQLSNIENRNILLINDEIGEEVEEYLANYGNDKNIVFIEGETEFSDETKENIMKISGGEKYELDKLQLIKPVNKEKQDKNKTVAALLNISQKKVIKKEDEKIVKDNKENEIIAEKIKETSKEVIKKTKEDADELLHNKGKIIAIEDNSENLENEENKEVKIVEILKEKENNTSVKILNNKDIEEKEEGYSLQLTYANPINIYSEVSEDKEEFIVPKETTDEIVKSVMNGDYGNGSVREQRLTREGYNYGEIQEKVDELEAEARRQQSTSQRRSSYTPKRTSGSININSGQAVGIDAFLNEAFKMKGWTYSQERRWDYGYADCSSIVIRAMINSGITKNTSNLTTHTIASDSRFYEIPMSQAKRGDILWYEGHMEIYMGGDSTFGAFRPGKPAGFGSNISRFTKAYRIK